MFPVCLLQCGSAVCVLLQVTSFAPAAQRAAERLGAAVSVSPAMVQIPLQTWPDHWIFQSSVCKLWNGTWLFSHGAFYLFKAVCVQPWLNYKLKLIKNSNHGLKLLVTFRSSGVGQSEAAHCFGTISCQFKPYIPFFGLTGFSFLCFSGMTELMQVMLGCSGPALLPLPSHCSCHGAAPHCPSLFLLHPECSQLCWAGHGALGERWVRTSSLCHGSHLKSE